MSERRTVTRQKSLLRGRIHFNHKRAAIDCVIRDVSETGARLVFSSVVPVPDAFDLYIPQKETTLRAQVQWRHGDEIGVIFAQVAPMADETPAEAEIAERMHKLEAEVAHLRRMLKRLQGFVPGADSDAA